MNTLHLLPTPFFSLSILPFLAFSVRNFPLPPVFGINGKEVKLDESYYISSILFPKPIGLCLVDNAKCPEDIIQCPAYYDDPSGLTVTFSSVNSTEDTVVRENTPYRIEFSVAAGNCSDENSWYIKDDGFANQKFVAIGPDTLAVEFIIQKVSEGYKIIYCVLIRNIPPLPICFGIGYLPEFGYNRLGIGKDVEPLQFFFANATTNSTTAMGSISKIA